MSKNIFAQRPFEAGCWTFDSARRAPPWIGEGIRPGCGLGTRGRPGCSGSRSLGPHGLCPPRAVSLPTSASPDLRKGSALGSRHRISAPAFQLGPTQGKLYLQSDDRFTFACHPFCSVRPNTEGAAVGRTRVRPHSCDLVATCREGARSESSLAFRCIRVPQQSPDNAGEP